MNQPRCAIIFFLAGKLLCCRGDLDEAIVGAYFCHLSHTERSERWYVSRKCIFCRFCFQWDYLTSEATLHFDLVKIALVKMIHVQPFCLVEL